MIKDTRLTSEYSNVLALFRRIVFKSTTAMGFTFLRIDLTLELAYLSLFCSDFLNILMKGMAIL